MKKDITEIYFKILQTFMKDVRDISHVYGRIEQ